MWSGSGGRGQLVGVETLYTKMLSVAVYRIITPHCAPLLYAKRRGKEGTLLMRNPSTQETGVLDRVATESSCNCVSSEPWCCRQPWKSPHRCRNVVPANARNAVWFVDCVPFSPLFSGAVGFSINYKRKK